MSPAAAGISIDLTSSAEVRNERLTVALQVRNSGNEAARSVSPRLLLGPEHIRGAGWETLPPQTTRNVVLSAPARTLGAGQWPFRAVVDFTDANGYAFQALHAANALIGAPFPAKLYIESFTVPDLSVSGKARLRLRNLSDLGRRITLTMLAPEGLEAAAVAAFELGPWEKREVSLKLINRSVLPGSSYPVFALAEYDEGSVHHCVIAHATVNILSPGLLTPRGRRWLWAAAALLALGWLIFLAWGKTRTRA